MMSLNVILRVTKCVLIGTALGSLFVLLSCLVEKENAGEPDEPGEGERGVLNLYGDGGEARLDFLETEPDETMDPWLVFREIPDPLMTYDVDKKQWTFSDHFLEDVADALVPVLQERGFVQNPQE